MRKISIFEAVTLIVLIIGGINWLLLGLLRRDLVSAVFGVMSPSSRVVYVVVGLCAIYWIFGVDKIYKK